MTEATTRVPQILIVDDDESLRTMACSYLASQSFSATGVDTLDGARELLRLHHFDLVVLDLNLAAENGMDLLRELAVQRRPPVIIASGRVEETDRVVGLELGADDYLIKPFSLRELAARIRVVLRRAAEPHRAIAPRRLALFQKWKVDLTAHRAIGDDGKDVYLTVGEMALLRVFLEHPDRVLPRHELVALTRGDDAVFSRSIDVLVTRLRGKLETDHHHPVLIRTVRGEGYLFSAPVTWTTLPD